MPRTLTAEKKTAAQAFATAFKPGMRVCVTTHVNADGDGLGSEVAMLHLLRAQGVEVTITNPTPTPPRFKFLLEDIPGADKSQEAVKEMRRADLILVLDISDLGRLGMLAETVQARGVPVACIDHHLGAGALPDGPRLVDPTASATGELVYEVAVANHWVVTTPAAKAMYVALLTDTGGFRFSNTTPRTLRIAADLLAAGVDPEQIYLDVYANSPAGRPRLFGEALQTLVVEPEYQMAWLTVPPGALERHNVSSDDLDGVVEFARAIEGVKLALLFREASQGRVKVSLRSVGGVDVAALARRFGGGGHAKAAGLALPGTLPEVQATILAAAREYIGAS
ncbi:MAG TPA: DHH family phosphoesterase [Gemmatimonadales bacterium]|nr:DHH family phosphoesterase [Gemmatimonadales bacterium]